MADGVLVKSYNPGCAFHTGAHLIETWSLPSTKVKECEKQLVDLIPKDKSERIRLLVRAIQLIDLTTLRGDDTKAVIEKVCAKGIGPINADLLQAINNAQGSPTLQSVSVAGLCVYPARVDDCRRVLRPTHGGINITSVVGGFPAGQTLLAVKKLEAREAILCGANEVDFVINRSHALEGDWERVYNEVKQIKETCDEVARLKVILATGELETVQNVYKASMCAMMAGADFIKTSTGKEAVNATIEVGTVMMMAIQDYGLLTGHKVGFKPAGGIKTAQDALTWMALVKLLLGDEWLQPLMLRFGASTLLDSIVAELHVLTGCPPPPDMRTTPAKADY